MQQELIYDWNLKNQSGHLFPHAVEVCDETLRDGIQSPSVLDPSIDHKLELISLMNQLGITIANIGLPGAGVRAYQDVLTIAKFVKNNRLTIKLNCAARTHQADILPIANIQQKVGIPITAYCFLGTSPIRQMVEDWSIDRLKKTTDEAISLAIKEGLSVAFVTEDTTRSHPDTLKLLFEHAISLGIERLVLCDTVGHATPDGVKALVEFTKQLIKTSGSDVKIDWHGHNDRGLAVPNALFAAQYGCHRIHGTALGVGERVGNTSMDQLIVNLKLLDAYPHDVSALTQYVEKASDYCQVPLAYNYPVFGQDAFRTATGVHAAAVIKAKKMGQDLLADTIYSGVPAYWFGKRQTIEIGPMSGASNVKYWLAEEKIETSDELVKALLDFAKSNAKVLTRSELGQFVRDFSNG
jgi:2-isopropylmalate synthase